MTEDQKLERDDLAVDQDMEVDCDTGHQITAYLEVWFDAKEFFSQRMDTSDVEWFDLYGKFDPYADTLRLECEAHHMNGRLQYFDHELSVPETELIKTMITEKLMEAYGQTPREFCEELAGNNITLGGIT